MWPFWCAIGGDLFGMPLDMTHLVWHERWPFWYAIIYGPFGMPSDWTSLSMSPSKSSQGRHGQNRYGARENIVRVGMGLQ